MFDGTVAHGTSRQPRQEGGFGSMTCTSLESALIEQYETSPLIDEIVDQHRGAWTPTSHDDWRGYRNHAQRVYIFARELLRQWDIDETDADEKLAIASAFHDIHVFQTLDYLAINNQSLLDWLTNRGQERWFSEIALAMSLHHRVRPYRGSHAWLVEAIRRADWVEVTMGSFRSGIARPLIRQTMLLLPTKEFARVSARRIAVHALTHPTNPLPFWRSRTALRQITRST